MSGATSVSGDGISILMAVKNNKKYLRSAVLSLLHEKISHLQIIIVDDASTDGSVEVVRDLPVELIRLSVSRGPAYAHNLALQEASREYVTILDGDDLLAPGGLRRRLEYLKANPAEVSVLGEVAGVIDSYGRYIGNFNELILPQYRRPGRYLERRFLTAASHFPAYAWLHLFRRSFLKDIGGMDATLRCSHDNDLFHRVIARGPIPFLPVPVAFYRMHEHNISGGLSGRRFEMSRIAKAETLLTHLEHEVPFH